MMDVSTALIGLILIALCVIPMVYFARAQKKEKRAFVKGFLQLASQHQITITRYDVWGNFFAIGLDSSTNQLFFFKKRGEHEVKTIINLSEVERCTLINKKVSLNGDQVIERLELAFALRNSKMPEQTLVFYKREETMALYDELQLIEKWKTIVNTQAESRRKLALAS